MPPYHLTPKDDQTVASLLRRVEALEFKLDQSKQQTTIAGELWTLLGGDLRPNPVLVYDDFIVAGGPGSPTTSEIVLWAGTNVAIKADGQVDISAEGGDLNLEAPTGVVSISQFNPSTGAATTLGTVIGQFAVYNFDGSLLGYAPIYDTIT